MTNDIKEICSSTILAGNNQSATRTTKTTENIKVFEFEKQGQEQNIDTLNFHSIPNADNKVNEFYTRIESLCNGMGITIENAKRLHILEIIAGVNSEAELAQLSEEEINKVINAVNETFSFALNPTARAKGIIRKIPIIKNFVDEPDDEKILQLAQDAKTRKILSEQEIGVGKQALFELTHREIADKVQKLLPKDREATNEEYTNAGKELFDKFLKNINELSDEEKKAKYDKIKEQYYLYLTKLHKNPDIAQNVLGSSISVLAAKDRYIAAQSFINSGLTDIPQRARSAQRFAEANIMTADAFGNSMNKANATAYQVATFSKMDADGAKISFDELSARANAVTNEFKKLLEKQINGTLSPNEQERYNELAGIINNYITTGFAGSSIGIAANTNIPAELATVYMQKISEETARLGIQTEVTTNVATFMNSHTEYNQCRSGSITTLLNKATGNKYSEIITKGNINCGKESLTNENSNIKEYEQNIKQKAEKDQLQKQIDKQVNLQVKDNKPEECAENSYIIKENVTIKNYTVADAELKNSQDSTYYTNPLNQTLLASTGENTEQSNKAKQKCQSLVYKELEFNKSVLDGISAVKEFAQNNNMSSQEVSIKILNSANAGQTATNYALEIFQRLTKPTKELVFDKSIKRNKSKIAAAKYMDTEQLMRLNNSSNIYVKKTISNMIEDEQKKAKV